MNAMMAVARMEGRNCTNSNIIASLKGMTVTWRASPREEPEHPTQEK